MKRFSLLRSLAFASSMLGLVALTATSATANCSVRYGYTASNGQNRTENVTLEVHERLDVHQGSMRYIRNRGDNPVRIQRSGPLGGDVDLAPDGRDPIAGTFAVPVILQTITCMPPVESAGLSVEQLVQQAFDTVSGQTLAVMNQLNTWRTSAEQWGEQTATDWGSCPSPGAQQSYNQLQTWRGNVNTAIGQTNQVLEDAQEARTNCMNLTGNSPLCGSTYNDLPAHGWLATLNSTKASIDASISAMRMLKCVDGCDQSVSLPVPTAQVEPGRFFSLRNPGFINVEVCTRMDMGEIGFDTDAVASGNVSGIVDAQPPSCSNTETLSICTNWDIDGLLAQLQRLRLVPPSVGTINLNIPMRTVPIVTGVQPARCRTPLRVCEPSGEVTISLNEGRNLFEDPVVRCRRQVTVACQDPPFGVAPTVERMEVPDLTQAELTWTDRRPGRIIVDLTPRDFQGLCLGRGRTALRIPRPPRVSLGQTTVDLPFLCTQPNWRDVVANP